MPMTKIGWVFPSIDSLDCSGGRKTIVNHINCLQCMENIEQIVYVHNETDDKKAKILMQQMFNLNRNVNVVAGHKLENTEEFDILFATWSLHTHKVANSNAKNKCYFIQDVETTFSPVSDNYFYSNESYSYNMDFICIGKYLKRYLKEKYNKESYSFDFTVDKEIYKRKEGVCCPSVSFIREDAICFLYQPEKPRRLADHGLKALQIVKQLIPNIKIYLYGSNTTTGMEPDNFINLKVLSDKDCAKLYNSCKLGMCFSPTNPSRIPFEMMACRLPVVDIDYSNFNKDDFNKNSFILSPSSKYEDIAITIYEAYKEIKSNSMSNIWMKTQENLEIIKDNKIAYNQFYQIVKEILNKCNS